MRAKALFPVAAVAAIAVLASPIIAAPAKPSKDIQAAVAAPNRTDANKLRLRDDVVTDGNVRDKVLANAPDAASGFFAVPKVIE